MFTPAVTLNTGLPPAFEMLRSDARAKPDASQQVANYALQLVMQTNPPGGWSEDRYAQTNHYTGAIALAIKPYLNAMRAAKVKILRRKPDPRKDGVITKSAGIGHYSRDEEYEPLDPDHPLCKIVARPNGDRGTWSMARELAYLTLQYMLTGDAPAWTPMNEDGKPVQLYALVSASTQLQFGPGQNPQYPKGAWRVTPYAGGTFGLAGGLYAGALLPGEEVHRLTDEHEWFRGGGRSRLSAGAVHIDTFEQVVKSRHSFLTSGPMLGAAIVIPGADKSVTDALAEQITQNYGGAEKHGKRILILGGGGMADKAAIQPLSMTSEELGFFQSYDQTLEFVLGLFGSNRVVAGVGEMVANKATYIAAKYQFQDGSLVPFFLRCSDFLTTALAEPWSEEPGELKIEVEPPPLNDIDAEQEQWDKACERGTVYWNEDRARLNLPTVGEEGDVPISVYVQSIQQQVAPEPQPGQDAIPGEEQPADGMPTEGDPEQASPEAAQDGITQAALEALGVGGAEEQPQPDAEEIQKAQRVKRNEGEKWTVGGQTYTKKNGKIYAVANQANKRQPTQPTGTPAANSPARVGEGAGAIVSNMYDAVRQSLEKTGDVPAPDRRAGSTFAQAWDMVKAAGLHTHPESAKRFTAAAQEASQDPRSKQGGAAKTQAWKDALNKHFAGMSPAGKPGASPQQQAASPTAQPATVPPKPTPQEDAASQEAWKRIPDANKALAAKKAAAFAKSPEGKAILQKADAWAHQQAAKHADKVAAKLKCSPRVAQYILANAIKMLCRQALESPEGSAETSLTLNQPGGTKVKLGIKRKPGPTSGGTPKPENRAAKGTGIARVGKAMGRSRRVRELVARVLEPLNEE